MKIQEEPVADIQMASALLPPEPGTNVIQDMQLQHFVEKYGQERAETSEQIAIPELGVFFQKAVIWAFCQRIVKETVHGLQGRYGPGGFVEGSLELVTIGGNDRDG